MTLDVSETEIRVCGKITARMDIVFTKSRQLVALPKMHVMDRGSVVAVVPYCGEGNMSIAEAEV